MCTWCWDVGMKGLRARENENLAPSTPHHHLGKASVVPGWQSIKKYSGFHLPCLWLAMVKAFGEVVAQQSELCFSQRRCFWSAMLHVFPY